MTEHNFNDLLREEIDFQNRISINFQDFNKVMIELKLPFNQFSSNQYIKYLERDIRNLESEVHYLSTTLGSVYNSKSWKITDPLRRINIFFERFLKLLT